jgi:hypothetical protein
MESKRNGGKIAQGMSPQISTYTEYCGMQGDQMSLLKNRPKCSPIHLMSKLMHNLKRGKSSPKILATSLIFKKN